MDGRVAPTAARPDINGVGKEAGRRENRLSVAGDHLEGSAMDVHGVDEAVVGADETHFQGLADLHADRLWREPLEWSFLAIGTSASPAR